MSCTWSLSSACLVLTCGMSYVYFELFGSLLSLWVCTGIGWPAVYSPGRETMPVDNAHLGCHVQWLKKTNFCGCSSLICIHSGELKSQMVHFVRKRWYFMPGKYIFEWESSIFNTYQFKTSGNDEYDFKFSWIAKEVVCFVICATAAVEFIVIYIAFPVSLSVWS